MTYVRASAAAYTLQGGEVPIMRVLYTCRDVWCAQDVVRTAVYPEVEKFPGCVVLLSL